MPPISPYKHQSNQQGSAMQTQGRQFGGATAENAAENAITEKAIAALKHEDSIQPKHHESEMYQDGYFPPTDDVDLPSSATEGTPSNLNDSSAVNTQQNEQKTEEPEIQIIETVKIIQTGEQVGQPNDFNAQGNLKGIAAENAQKNLQGAAATAGEQKQGVDGQVPTIGQGGIVTHGLHGAAAEAKKGHLMGAAAEAKKGHLMGAAAENVKGNLQGAAAIAHEQKLQREQEAQRHGRVFDSQGNLVGAAAESAKGNLQGAAAKAHDQKVQREGEDGEFITPQDQAQLSSENEGHHHGRGFDSKGNLVGAAAQSAQGTLLGAAATAHEQKMQRARGHEAIEESVPKTRNTEEDTDEAVPPKQAKYDEFNLRNQPSDVSAH